MRDPESAARGEGGRVLVAEGCGTGRRRMEGGRGSVFGSCQGVGTTPSKDVMRVSRLCVMEVL